jgi:O-antigen/teichoic acid export membrane protein
VNEQLTKLIRNAAVYGFGRIVGKVISFLLIPFYTHYFSAGEYGVMEILNLTAMVAAVLLAPGLSTAVMRFYYDTDDPREKQRVISTGLIFTLLVGGLASLATIVFPAWMSQTLLGSARYSMLVRLVAGSFFFTFTADICWVYLRGKQRSGLYTLLTQAFIVSSVALNVYFVAVLKMGVAGSFWANIASGSVVWAILVGLTFREVGFHFSPDKLWGVLRFGAPLFTVWLAAFVLNYSDRFFLQRFHGIDAVGVYAVGYKFAYVLSLLVIQPFQLMWEPQAYEISKRDDAADLFSRIFVLYSVALIAVTFFLSLCIREVFEVMVGDRFVNAYKFVPLLAFAYALQGMGLFFEAGLLIRKKNLTLSLVGITSTLTCLGLNFSLIRVWGAWGAVWATLLSFAFLAVASYWSSVRVYPFHCNLAVFFKVLGWGAALLLAGYFLPGESLAVRIAFKSALMIAFVVVLARMRLLPSGFFTSMCAEMVERVRGRLSPIVSRVGSLVKGVN